MPNTILKRWNGSTFEELYPKTTVGQISASGTPSSSTFLRGDGQWITPAGGGDVVGPASSVSGRVATFNGTTGKLIQDGGKLLSDLVSGPASSTTGNIPAFSDTTGKLLSTGRSVSDSSTANAISSASTNLPTERDIYYGLPFINNSHAYTSSTTIYAPTTGGTSGQFLQAVGATSTPTWATKFTNVYTNSTPLTISSGTTQTITFTSNASTINVGVTGNPGSYLRIVWGPTTATYIVSYTHVMPTDGSNAFTYIYTPLDVISSNDVYYMLYIRANATGVYTGTSWIVGGGKTMTMAGTQANATMYLRSIDLVNF